MKRAMLLVGLFLMLGGCPAPSVTNNMVDPEPTGTPSPLPWLSVDPVCTGSLTRAEWLVCDNTWLMSLHRRLAQQWATARQYASPEREQMLENQLYALLSERDQCQDDSCVANAYRRYLDGASPAPAPAPRPVVRPPAPPPKKWVRPAPPPRKWHRPGKPAPNWEPRGDEDDGPTCTGTAGGTEATRLARQCDRVTSGQNGSCSPQRSCGTLRRNIARGCNETYRKPDFCPRL
jgi:hypothetical protein